MNTRFDKDSSSFGGDLGGGRSVGDADHVLRVFAEHWDVETAEEAVVQACADLRARVEEQIPPIGLKRIVRACRARCVEVSISTAGRLALDQSGYLITVKSGTSWRRRRFTVAHEIGHILLLDAMASDRRALELLQTPAGWREAERLCNLAAAELLIPKDDLVAALATTPFTPEGLRVLYDRYLTSFTTLFIRLVEVTPGSTLTMWQKCSRRIGEPLRWRVVRSFRASIGPWFPNGMTGVHLSPDLIEAAAENASASSSHMHVDLYKQGFGLAVASQLPGERAGVGLDLPHFHGFAVPDEPLRTPQIALLVAQETPSERLWNQ